MALGGALCAAGALCESVFLTVAGASLVTVGGGLANICVGLACTGLTLRRAGIAVVWSYVASFVLRGLFRILPLEANLAMFLLFPIGAVALSARLSLRVRDFPAAILLLRYPSLRPVRSFRSAIRCLYRWSSFDLFTAIL